MELFQLSNFFSNLRAYAWWQVGIELLLIGMVVFWVVRFLRGTRGARLGAFWRRDIVIRIGEPFRAADLAVKADDAQAVTDAIMRRVAALMPPEQRGVYR